MGKRTFHPFAVGVSNEPFGAPTIGREERDRPMTDALLPGSAKSEEQHSREICIAGRWLYERGYIVACEGNLSVRLDENRILNTPTCMNKGTLSPEDLVITDLNGAHISGKRKVSSEVAMHLLFYRMRPDVQAI